MNDKVMLLVFEGVPSRHERTRIVFEKMCSLGGWESCRYVEEEMSYAQANRMEIGGYLDYMSDKSSHLLVCTWDGFIINPHLWDEEWLNYDMIGSPWPRSWNTGGRVGNMGFNMQSRRFMKIARKHSELYRGEPGDVFLCQKMKVKFESEGIIYAPVEKAARFGWEHDIEEKISGPDKSFGFHGWVNGKNQKEYYERLSSLAR